jgi:hypothetical protein
MFTVNIGDDEFKVEFNYPDYGEFDVFGHKLPKETHCRVLDDFGDVVAHGYAICSHRDQFNKNTGRKLALSRALSDVFTREERQLFWDAYFQARNGRYD